MARRRFTYNLPSLSSYLPFSGNVMQSLFSSWFSPSFNFEFAGDPEVESRVVTDVASYGRQLGWLTDIALALGEHKQLPPDAADSFGKLQKASKEIAEIKKSAEKSELEEAKDALDRLKRNQPDAYVSLLRDRGRA
jgi:hypothetical protein